MKNKKQWIVGKANASSLDDKGNFRWSFVGVFDDRHQAIEACVDEDYFLGPAILNKAQLGQDVRWKGVWYPVAESNLSEAEMAILDE